jgi:ferritin-like metal-binding protein YciE
MAEITTPRDLFLHELGDILYVEQQLAEEVLPMLISEVQLDEFRKALEQHLDETRSHVTNLEEVFDLMGEQPKTEKCVGFEGLKKEHEELVGKVSPELRDGVHSGAVARTEHYEIAAYSGLIEKSRALDERDAVTLFEENLKQEREALRNAESIEKTLRDELKTAAS